MVGRSDPTHQVPRTMRPAHLLLALATAALLAACASAGPTPVPSASPAAPVPTVAPSAAPGDVPTPAPATPSPTPAATPDPTAAPTATPRATPGSGMTAAEAALVRLLRADATVDCGPRRTDLPDGAKRGIECRVDGGPVARVGVYWFASENEAAYAYMTRMAAAGVDVNAGDCNAGVPGERAYTSGDGEGRYEDPGVFNWENSVLAPARIGCFREDDGTANVRLTCGQAYIGILGTGTDVAALHDWAWRFPKGYEPGTPSLPGICIGEAALEAGA